MARRLFAAFIIFYALPGAVPAHAARTGDMFSDQGYIVYDRPPVPSDQYYGYINQRDMFPAYPPYLRTDKDMFDSVQPPGDPAFERKFSAHVPYVPADPLYEWPRDNPYP